jgi:hypothetical protein
MAAYAFADCRDLRHAWARVDDEVLLETDGQIRLFQRTLACMRCDTKRRDTYQVNTHGPKVMTRLGAKYDYAFGYQVKGGLDVEALRWSLYVGTVSV